MTQTTKPNGATPEQIEFNKLLTRERQCGQYWYEHLLNAQAELRTLRQHNASLSGAGDILSATLHEQEAENTALRQANADLLAADKMRQGVVEALRGFARDVIECALARWMALRFKSRH